MFVTYIVVLNGRIIVNYELENEWSDYGLFHGTIPGGNEESHKTLSLMLYHNFM
jgi:hypothetical protein